jgi:predicted PurR-regulated permease PerM
MDARAAAPASEPAAGGEAESVEAVHALSGTASSVRLLAIIGVVAALWWAQSVLIPLVLSILVSYALEPVIVRLGAWRVPRTMAVPLVLVAVLGIGAAGAYSLRGEAVAFVGRLPSAFHSVAVTIQGAVRAAPGVARVREAARELETATNNATRKNAPDGVTPVRIEEPTFKWSDWLWQGSHGLLQLGGQMFLALCLVYYLLIAGDLWRRKLVHIVPTLSSKKLTLEILAEIDRQIERYLLARVVISLTVGVVVWLTFRAFGLASAGVWGVIATVLFAIPVVGPTAVIAASTIAAFLQFGSAGMALSVCGAGLIIGALEGNVLTPWLLARFGQMNAVAVFVSLLFWGWIWGFWGLLLAVPIMAAVKTVCERIPEFDGFAEWLRE